MLRTQNGMIIINLVLKIALFRKLFHAIEGDKWNFSETFIPTSENFHAAGSLFIYSGTRIKNKEKSLPIAWRCCTIRSLYAFGFGFGHKLPIDNCRVFRDGRSVIVIVEFLGLCNGTPYNCCPQLKPLDPLVYY